MEDFQIFFSVLYSSICAQHTANIVAIKLSVLESFRLLKQGQDKKLLIRKVREEMPGHQMQSRNFYWHEGWCCSRSSFRWQLTTMLVDRCWQKRERCSWSPFMRQLVTAIFNSLFFLLHCPCFSLNCCSIKNLIVQKCS